MEKWKQIKKKHHYVWEYYLKKWSVEGGVFWLTPTRKISCDSPKGLCREDGFYKISILDEVDVNYILEYSKLSPVSRQETHKIHLKDFVAISNLIKLSKASNIEDGDLRQCEEIQMYNTLENLYSGIESEAKPAIDRLSNGDTSIMENTKASIGLYSYIGHQITRTKAVKVRFIENLCAQMPPSVLREEHLRLIEKNWWFLCYMFGDNIGFSLFSSRNENRFILVRNKSSIPFITSDSPVVNIHLSIKDLLSSEPPEHADHLFPLSPDYVLIIAQSSDWDFLKDGANSDSVVELNSRVARNASASIFGNSRKVIEENMDLVRR